MLWSDDRNETSTKPRANHLHMGLRADAIAVGALVLEATVRSVLLH